MCKLPFLTVSSVGRTEGVDKILSLKLGSLLSFSKIIIFIFENTIRKYASPKYKYEVTVPQFLQFLERGREQGAASTWEGAGAASRGRQVVSLDSAP